MSESLVAQHGAQRDFVRKPISALLLWWLPIGIGVAQSPFGLPYEVSCAVWAVGFAWMGSACLINAYRCHRLHCYIAGPVFLAGSVTSVLLALDAIPLGYHALNYVVAAVLSLAILSFAPEMVWRKYI